jgi:hypothetical protein
MFLMPIKWTYLIPSKIKSSTPKIKRCSIKNLLIILFSLKSLVVFGFDNQKIWRQYQDGVSKAQNILELKQPRPLFNINSDNSFLEVACNPNWECSGGIKDWEKNGRFKPNVRIKMVSFIASKNAIYDNFTGLKPYPLNGYNMWVTAFPELKNFCKGIRDKSSLKLELDKFLGLPPDSDKGKVLTLWAKTSDLARPCFSLNVSTTSCPIKLSREVDEIERKWLEDTIKSSFHNQEKNYPFTRMGYAYYWGNSNNFMGASEYVIRGRATIYIEKVETIADYCK